MSALASPETIVVERGPEALNARGLPIAASRTGIENFWRWFDSSQVVDAQGRPREMFHSTVGDFDAFKTRPGDLGIHFGTAGQAEDRCALKFDADPYGPELRGVTHATLAVYLRIRKPLRMLDMGWWSAENLTDPLADKFPHLARTILAARSVTQLRAIIRQQGYDGIVYMNGGESAGGAQMRARRDAAWRDVQVALGARKTYTDRERQHPVYLAYRQAGDACTRYGQDHAADSFIAFEPGQIKSATGNSGAFNPQGHSLTDLVASKAQPRRMRGRP